MTVTTESGGRQNAFPTETRPYIDDSVSYEGYPQNAEKVNGRWYGRNDCTTRCIHWSITTGQMKKILTGKNKMKDLHRTKTDDSRSMKDFTIKKKDGQKDLMVGQQGFVAAIGAYATTGQIIPGIF